jgi:hypothetical protein
MQLKATDFGWYFATDECRVGRIEIDFRLCLLLADRAGTATVCIETGCRLSDGNSTADLNPADQVSLCPILPFFNAKVAGVSIHKTGTLTINFENGGALTVDPDESYEAWQIAIPAVAMLVCQPGGAVCEFCEPGGAGEHDAAHT